MVRSRYAFTMIELIFAIVIIAISVMSLPMMTRVTAQGIENNLVQEAIFAASAELNQAVTHYWDANSIDGNISLSRVIDTGDCDATTRLRLGHISQPYHRRCLDSNTTGISNAVGGAGQESLDNAAHANQTIYIGDATTQHGYKKAYDSNVTVAQNVNFNGANNQNMKSITVNILDGANVITSLKTYSANIGEIDYYKRTYP